MLKTNVWSLNQYNMTTLIFATNNKHKVEEIQAAIGDEITVVSLAAAGIEKDIPEPFDTLEENASTKSKTIFELTGRSCFSEDTGLEVMSLNGAPGVKSARFAGEKSSSEENNEKLLRLLDGKTDRTARFRTIISLIWEGKEYQFEGICPGIITTTRYGAGGFGYDPVFQPAGSDRCFAEMSLQEKNQFSHRNIAATKLVEFLRNKISERP